MWRWSIYHLCVFWCLTFFFTYCHWFWWSHLISFSYSKRFCHCKLLHSMPYCGARVGHWHLQGPPPPHARAHISISCHSTRNYFCSSSSEDGKAQFWFVVCVSSLFDFSLLSLHFFLLHSLFFSLLMFFPWHMYSKFHKEARSTSSMQTYLQLFWQCLSSLHTFLDLSINLRRYHPHPLLALNLSTNFCWTS